MTLPEKPKRRWGIWIALASAAVVVCCVAGVVVAAVVVGARRPSPSPSVTSAQQQQLPCRPETTSPGDALRMVREVLAKQREALLAGDETAYLAALDPQIPAAEKEGLTRQFRSLRAMQVAQWCDEADAAVGLSEAKWSIDVLSTACFVTKDCARGPATATTVWQVSGGTATLTSWKPSKEIHPWQADDLLASSGARTIVATTKAFAGKLPNLVKEAEKAAVIADRFAQEGSKPQRYVIYYAGTQADWKEWFDWNPPDWSAGVAIHVSKDRYELLLNGDETHASEMDDLLRHELTHAASLPGAFKDGKQLWWLIEGIAELAEMEGAPARSHPGLSGIRQLLKSGTVTSLEVAPPTDETEDELVSGRYGIAFLGARCISERFSEPKLVEFFYALVHGGKTVETAAPEVLGIDWTTLNQECFTYVKETAA